MPRSIIVRVFLAGAILLIPLTIYLAPLTAAFIVSAVGFLAPLWLPALLVYIGIPLWLTFVRSHFASSIPYSTIELKPGGETPRTAKAMELVFYSLHHRVDHTLLETYVLGHIRMPWAFELWAHAGSVRFFVHLPTAHRTAVESRIRAEYRDIDIDEVSDYAREISFNPASQKLFMREFTLAKPDPYPLKTYLAHESERNHRDIFSDLLEELSHLSEHEHLCLSLIIRPHQRERRKLVDAPKDYLHEDAKKEIGRLLGRESDVNVLPNEQKRLISAIESALKKPSFDCGLRALYVAKREHMAEGAEARLAELLDRFNDPELNSFASYDPLQRIGWPLSEIFAVNPELSGGYLMQLYRRRAFFAPPYFGKPFVLNTEELATVFRVPHFARSSALAGIRGVRLEPPANLPV